MKTLLRYIEKNVSRKIGALFIILVCTSCGSSSLTATWYDSGFAESQKLQDILIIAITKDETIKRLYEDQFVETLGSYGVKAMGSYSLSQPDIKPTKEAVDAAVKEAGAKSVLITRYLGTDTKQHYRPPQRSRVFADPYYGGIHGYYPMAYREVYTPGYTVTVNTVSLESNVYDVASGSLIWSARSESINPSLTKKYVDELVKLFSNDLKKANLL